MERQEKHSKDRAADCYETLAELYMIMNAGGKKVSTTDFLVSSGKVRMQVNPKVNKLLIDCELIFDSPKTYCIYTPVKPAVYCIEVSDKSLAVIKSSPIRDIEGKKYYNVSYKRIEPYIKFVDKLH